MAADGGNQSWQKPRFELLEDRIVLDGVPDVSISGPGTSPDNPTGSTVPIGAQDVAYTLTFNNSGTGSGYVPYIDLIVPTTGEDGDDGVTLESASFLGTDLAPTEIVFDVNGEAVHPLATDASGDPIIVSGTPGDTLVVLELPYGSFSPANPPVDVNLVFDFSPDADLDEGFTLQAIGGFALGCDPLDNPGSDEPIRADTPVEHDVGLSLFSVTKANNIPEAVDAATGPSYPYTYSLNVNVAEGQELTDFVLTDVLPPEIVYLGNLRFPDTAGNVITEPPVDTLVAAPDNIIEVEFPTISGSATVLFDFYINDVPSDTTAPLIPVDNGDEQPVVNRVSGIGTWTPTDSDDDPRTVTDDARNETFARSIAVQKTNALVVDADPDIDSPVPGDIYEFTLNVQVSDYFTFSDIVLTDILGDGWEYLGNATFETIEQGESIGNRSIVESPGSGPGPDSGQTTLIFDVSQYMVDAGEDEILAGDIARDGVEDGTQTTVRITYQAQILDADSTGTEFGQGSTIGNSVTVLADVLDNDDPDPNNPIGEEDEVSASGVIVPNGAIREKTVYAVNGNTAFDPDVPISAGDTVTFSIIYDAPVGSFSDLEIVDSFPQNVFDSTEVLPGNFLAAQNGTPPPAGFAQYGPSDEFFALSGTTPSVSDDDPNNTTTFDFGGLSADPRQPLAIEILVTVTVVDAVFAPELLLTNQSTAFEVDYEGNRIDTTAIAFFTYSEPVLEITKGVVSSTSGDSDNNLTAPAGPVAFDAPQTGNPPFSDTINSGGLDATPIDANIRNVDAGDVVTFAIVVENTTRAPNGAFNVTIADTLPTGFAVPTGPDYPLGLNLSITDGSGTAYSVENANPEADLFAGGITLVDDSPILGALGAFSETSGDNLAIITYDLVVVDTVSANQNLTNTASVAEYNALEGSPADPPLNRIDVLGPVEDDATATIEEPDILKIRNTKEFDEVGTNEVLVGETFTYIIEVDLSEGVLGDVVVSDTVTQGGLQLLSGEIVTYAGESVAGAGTTITNTAGLDVGSAGVVNAGQTQVTFDFGDIVVAGDNDEDNNIIEILITAAAPDDRVGSAGELLQNRARLDWDAGQVNSFLGERLTEPNLQMEKNADPGVVEAGDTVSYSVEIENIAGSNDAPAFDLRLEDTLDPNLTLDPNSIQILVNGSDVTPALDTPGGSYEVNTAGLPANTFEIIIDRLDEGDVVVVNYEGTVSTAVEAGLTIPNTAELTFDSTPEDEPVDEGDPADSDDRGYSLSAPAEVLTAGPEIDKQVVASSNPDTDGTELSIGEEVTYEITITIPDGNIEAVTLEDVLPDTAGGVLSYVSSQLISVGEDLTISGLPGALPAPFGTNSGQSTEFAFGDIANLFDTDPDPDAADQIVVQVTAVLIDDPDNQETDPATPLVNTATLTYTNGDDNVVTVEDTASVSAVEPDLDITKTPDPAVADAGEVITYTITSTNNGGGPAYDIIIDDDLAAPGIEALLTSTPTIRILDAGNAVVTPDVGDEPSVAFVGGALQAIIPELGPGETIEIVFQATVTDAALFSSPVPNTAEVTRYDSDAAGDATDPAGLNERVYDENLAGYNVPSADAEVQTPDVTLTKAVIGTSDDNTAGTALGVGETVTYELSITVPQGTADLTLTDVLPDGLSAQSASFVRVDNDSGLTSDIPLLSTQTGVGASNGIEITANGDSVVFDFGTVVVPGEADGAATDTVIVVSVTALVEDILPDVADGATLENTATLQVRDPADTDVELQPDVEASEEVQIVEPDVSIVKSSPVGANQGDIVPYTITLQNDGTGPAYDLEVIDTLADPNLTLDSGSIVVSLNGVELDPQPTITETAPDGFIVEGLTLLPDDVIEIAFGVLLEGTAPDAETFVNTATANFDTVEDGDPDSDTGRDFTVEDDSQLATVPRVEKVPFASNFIETDSTTGSDPFALAIGEEVTYRYTLTLPEIPMDSVILADSLPEGMRYVGFNVVSSGFGYSGTPGETVAANGRDVEFDFGAITNPEDGSIGADDELIFEVTAVVVDDPAAFADATLTNTVGLTVTPQGEAPLNTQEDSADVVVVEPLLEIDKTAPLSVALGGDADFEVAVTNVGVSGAEGPAYDVLIADTLDPEFTLDTDTIEIRLGGALITPTVTTTANSFSFEVPVVDVGETVTVSYTATLDADAPPTVDYENTATADYTSAPGDNPNERTYDQVEDTETVATDPTLTKTAIGSSDALTGSGEHEADQLDATIGEEVTFEMVLTLPEIPMDSVVLVDTLPPELAFVSASVDTVGAGLTFGASSITDAGQTVTYSFTDVINPDDGSIGADDQITVLITARVLDVAANFDGEEITNSAVLTVTPEGEPALNPQTATTDIDVVEPLLEVEKTGNIAIAPGETVSYTATITNNGTAPAYDAFIEDTLGNPFLTLETGTVQVTLDGVDVTSLLTITETATGFEFLLYDAATPATLPIEVGESLVVTYDATLAANAPEANSFPNTISADYDTVGDGDPNSPTARDYSVEDDHSVATVPFVNKTPVASTFDETDSETGSSPFQLAIGETVTYEYEIYLPEIDMDSVVVTDTLPDGLSYQGFSIVSFGTPDLIDTDDAPLTDPSVTVNGQEITFDFGDVRNLTDGTIGDDDVITLQVTAVVTDDPSNVAGATLINEVDLDVDPTGDDPFPTRSNTAEVEIVEPELTIDKTGPTVAEPGDEIDYAITIENTGPDGAPGGPAYDLVIEDSLPSDIVLDAGSLVFTIVGQGTVTPTSLTTGPGGFVATIPVLDIGQTLTVEYTGELSDTVEPPASFPNTATVNYDSAPGDNPNERTYDEETDDHRVATPPTLDKTIISTSQTQTGDAEHNADNPDVSIGELITYQLVVTLPEIPTDNVTLTDTLPTGLSFVEADIVSVGSEIVGVTDTDEATVVSTSGQDVIFNFGDIENTYSDGTIDGADEIIVTVTVRVDDLASVNDGDVLTNEASLVLTPEGEAPLDPVEDQTSVDVVEPEIDIVKSVSDDEPMQGDVITYTVVVTNDVDATGPAFNLVVTDPLPVELTLTGDVTTTGATSSVTSSSGDTLIISIPVLLPGETVTIEYDVFVGYSTPVFEDVVNIATVEGSTNEDPDNPGRSLTDDDDETIEVEPVPELAFEEPQRLVGGGIDDERFLPILLIDPIYTGTAEYGANVTISLYQWDGSLSYVRNVVADAGGHWIAIFPRVTLDDVEDDFHQRYERSVLFREPVQYLDDRAGFDSSGAPIDDREFFIGTELEDDSYTIRVDHDRPSTLPQDRGMFNARVFFSPSTIGEPYVRGDVLNVDEVFENVANLSVERLYEASVDPLATGLNRFNYEFLSEETAIPGGSAR